MQLNPRAIRYSKGEQRVFEVLPKDGTKLDTVELTDRVYGRKQRPYNARQSILGTLKSLAAKAKRNKEAFTLNKSERTGPHPIQFWIEVK